MANKRRDLAKERFWGEMLAQQVESGLSVRAFCARAKLTESAFYAWRRVIAERNGEAKPARRRSAFVPLTVVDSAARRSSIEIELAGGHLLRLPESMPAGRLAEVVQALEGLWRAAGERP
jgi:putative transposase